MTLIWVHELGAKAASLMDRLRDVLAETEGTVARELLGRAQIAEHTKPRMVLTGQFSGGKSTLIEALTDRAVRPLTGADYTTDEITEYPWSGAVILVDTPGVKSGVRSHDDLANEAIGNSDFILFVVDVGLFDDASRDYLRHLAHDRRKFEQMIVVITKAKKMAAQPGARKAAVQEALGTSTFQLPVVEVDSNYYLRGLEDGPSREHLRRESRIDELKGLINEMSEAHGQLAHLRRPYQLIRQLCDEAQGLYLTDPDERLALSVLAGQRKAVTERRMMIDTAFTTAESKFKSRCLVDITAFVDAATELPEGASDALAAAEQTLVAALKRHAEAFAGQVNLLAEHQFAVLAEQLGEITQSNRATALLRYSVAVAPDVPSSIQTPAVMGGAPSKSSRNGGSWMRDVGAWLEQGKSMWGAGDGIKASSGTWGHSVVKDVGHAFGAKFKPWQAVKIANLIGKAAKAAGFLIKIATEVKDVLDNERAAHREQIAAERRHAAFVTEIMGHADQIAADARRQLNGIVHPAMNEFLANVDVLQERILEAGTDRDARSTELTEIARAADCMLDLSTSSTVIEAQTVLSE